jgi:hypothetical protein
MKRGDRSNRHLVLSAFLTIACQKNTDVADAATPSRTTGGATGTLVGHIRTDAKPLAAIAMTENVKRVCGDSASDRTLLIGEGGALENALVFISDAPEEAAPARTLLMDQKRCAYDPPMLVAHTGEMLTVKNSDPLVHNVRAQSAGTDLFNIAMPIENLTIRRAMPMTPGLVHVGCDVHPWMRAAVYVLAHNRWAVTDARGAFRIEGVEAGKRAVHVWHAVLGEKTVSAAVPAGGSATLDEALSAAAP